LGKRLSGLLSHLSTSNDEKEDVIASSSFFKTDAKQQLVKEAEFSDLKTLLKKLNAQYDRLQNYFN
jgi:hypothetical protein